MVPPKGFYVPKSLIRDEKLDICSREHVIERVERQKYDPLEVVNCQIGWYGYLLEEDTM